MTASRNDLYAAWVPTLAPPVKPWEHLEVQLAKHWLRLIDVRFRLSGHRKSRFRKKVYDAERDYDDVNLRYLKKGGIPF